MADAKLAHDWYPVALPHNVVIGERSWVYSSYAFLHCRSRRPCAVQIGHDSGVYHESFFELGPSGEVVIGNFCSVVGAIIATNHRVEIEDYALIAHDVLIADRPAMVPPIDETDGEPGPGIRIGRNAWVCTRAILLGGAEVGEGAIIGAPAIVDFAVPDYAVVAGNPARIIGWAPPRR